MSKDTQDIAGHALTQHSDSVECSESLTNRRALSTQHSQQSFNRSTPSSRPPVPQKYENAFLKYAKIDPYFVIDFSKDKVDKVDRHPNAKDCVQAKNLMIFLEAFYDATKHLSGTYVTSNLLFFEIVAIYKMLQNLENIDEVIDVQDIEIGVHGEED
ncbi:unnamed protein product [Cuscuta campestris]|uniref:Uncharacterized protein n=1 Tax=Cuscuta campestris TaxID=132261 RepID=A0A484KYA3_9ASTE|nr:unnamed protein product [Cuscuta campestris]